MGSPEDLGETHASRLGDRDLNWRVFEGTLWYQVDGMPLRRGMPSALNKFGVAEFEAFLAGGRFEQTPDCTDLGYATCRTPLAAVSLDARALTNGAVIGPHDHPPFEIEVSEIYEDGRASAADELRRFMDERVRVVGNVVLIRAYDPLVTSKGRDGRSSRFRRHAKQPTGLPSTGSRSGTAPMPTRRAPPGRRVFGGEGDRPGSSRG